MIVMVCIGWVVFLFHTILAEIGDGLVGQLGAGLSGGSWLLYLGYSPCDLFRWIAWASSEHSGLKAAFH